MRKMRGVHLKHHKNTASAAPVRMSVPSRVVLPMAMHIGAPALPVVKVGDSVKVGQLVGQAAQGLSSPVYASVSGKVKKIDEMINALGARVTTVIIESDGEQSVYEDIKPPLIECREDFISAVKDSGIVGLGGAGFPTYAKLNCDVSKIDAIVVNGAECEPYITSDTRTMLDEAELVAEGLGLVMKYLEADRAVIGIEENKPECIERMRASVADMKGVEIKKLPSVYPQGGEKVLVYNTLGRVIEEGKLPLDCGVIVINTTTAASIAKYVRTGMPLVEKCVTVDGSAVANPQNVIVPIGTPIGELIDFCEGFSQTPRKILSGGPMMGSPIADVSMPVLKQTNAILAFGKREAEIPSAGPCIKCGRCVSACPFGLAPCDIAAAMKAGDTEKLEKLKVNLCMECGCCSYVCPAKKDIVQNNKLAKAKLRQAQMARKEEKR